MAIDPDVEELLKVVNRRLDALGEEILVVSTRLSNRVSGLEEQLAATRSALRDHAHEPSPAPTPAPTPASDTWATSRDPYVQPFSSKSVWNRPVAKEAHLVHAGLQPANAWKGKITVDKEFLGMDPTAPVKTLTATQQGNKQVQVRVPPSLSHDGSWNGCATLVTAADPYKVIQGQRLTLNAGGDPKWDWTIPSDTTYDIRTDDGVLGCHGGGRLSGIGGSIRVGELTSPDPIRHVLKINLYGKRFLSRASGGFRWPAVKADTGFDSASTGNYYDGPVPACRMGSLLVLPFDGDYSFVSHPVAKKLVWTLRHYGGLVVDNTAWDVHAFCFDNEVVRKGEWPSDTAFHQQMQSVFTKLAVVDNNESSTKCSGGYTPVAPLLFAPEIV